MSERQAGIEPSHIARYILAKSFIENGSDVLDAFCGTGYGSRMLSTGNRVVCFDKFNHENTESNVEFIQATYPDITFGKQFDTIVCFEAIEHLPRELSKNLLQDFRKWLRPYGQLFISSPNQLNYPFDAKKIEHHYFHYKPEEMENDLNNAGFKVDRWWNQKQKFSFKLDDGYDGRYMICRCV